MGSSSWSNDSYSHIKRSTANLSTNQVFTQTAKRQIASDMDPKGVKFRESRDSDTHPNSLAVFVALDQTGSMGSIPETLVKQKLGALMETIIKHGTPDAHVLFSAVGDHVDNRSWLQVGQFEAGTEELNKWLTSIDLVGHGGGQDMEDYALAWFFAARHTSIDCFEKRQQKGFLFTIGDEFVHPSLDRDFLTGIMGYELQENITAEQALSEAQRMYHVFHLHCQETATGSSTFIQNKWKSLLGERVIFVEDYNNIAEIIASTVAVVNGANIASVVSDFDAITAGQVTKALTKVTSASLTAQKEGVMKL